MATQGLFENRNTGSHGMTFSPTQRFLSRRAKSSLPVSESLLRWSVPPLTVMRDEHLDKRAKVKSYYDCQNCEQGASWFLGNSFIENPVIITGEKGGTLEWS